MNKLPTKTTPKGRLARPRPAAPAASPSQQIPRVLQTKSAAPQRPQTDQLPRRPIAQSKNPASALSVKQPVAPPIYKPQLRPLIAERKTMQLTLHKSPPVAPPAYHPRSVPQVSQMKNNVGRQAKNGLMPRGVNNQPQRSEVLQRKASLAVRHASSTIQRASSYASEARAMAVDAGARLEAKVEWVDLDTVPRTRFRWFGSSIMMELGIDEKPKPGSKCQNCGKVASAFELDHMTPWRHYCAALLSEKYLKKGPGKSILARKDMVKVLYNDPTNLWWICRDCNNPKSDIIPESAEHAAGDFADGVYGRHAMKPSAIIKESKPF
ncbi:MAG TPA: hypothetical protein VGD61_16970 [Pyrinomonadaceae bacterium]